MKPETAAFLAKSKEFLVRAPLLLAQNFVDEARRAAYLAGFHAAQAFIFEKQDRSPKTHTGVQTEFARLEKAEADIDIELRAFPDYETGPGAKVTHAQALEAIESGSRFVVAIERLIGK